jgi:outer membrane lipopolysaccharide assembly protein LptE/RlpB
MTTNTSTDEIDLLKLIMDGYRTLRKNLALLIVCSLLGILTAVALIYLAKNKYSSSMMITTDLLSQSEAEFIFNELDRTDSVPGLNKHQGRSIKNLSFSVEDNPEDKTVYLKVNAEVITAEIYPVLEDVILDYLNKTNPVVRNRKERTMIYNEMLKKIDEEIAGMEAVKKQTDTKAFASFISPADLYTKTVELYQKRTEIKAGLEHIQSIHLVKGFGSLMKETKMAMHIAGFIGFVSGIFLALIIIFIRFLDNYSKAHKV